MIGIPQQRDDFLGRFFGVILRDPAIAGNISIHIWTDRQQLQLFSTYENR